MTSMFSRPIGASESQMQSASEQSDKCQRPHPSKTTPRRPLCFLYQCSFFSPRKELRRPWGTDTLLGGAELDAGARRHADDLQ